MKAGQLFSLVLITLLISCHSKSGNSASPENTGNDNYKAPGAFTTHLIGSYVGSFGDNKITVLITKANADSIEGRSVVGGNDRPFSGMMKQDGDNFTIVAKEPGGDSHDGTFNFVISKKTPDIINGSWSPFNPTEKITAKDYRLQRKAFAYLVDAGDYPQASKRLLVDSDINNLTKEELEQMRNEIFARHGYCFKKKALREIFEDKDWYVPNTTDIKNILTDTERKNISLIKKYEKYAEEYGDEFGR